VKDLIHSVDGVTAIHTLRTRSIGGEVSVDVHVLVEHWLSVSEGHMISQTVMDLLMEQVDDIGDVTVHVDPEDDETGSPTKGLPLRSDILDKLNRSWQTIPRAANIKRTILHYLDGKIDIDLYFPLSCYDGERDLDDLRAQLQEPLKEWSEVRALNIFFG
jgi:zinc transporter family protein